MINLKLFSCVLTRLHKRKHAEFSKAKRSVWKKSSCFSTNILYFNMESKYLYTTYGWKYATVNIYLYCTRTLQINKCIEMLMYLGKHKLSVKQNINNFKWAYNIKYNIENTMPLYHIIVLDNCKISTLKTVSATIFYLYIITEMRNIYNKTIFTCPSKCIINHQKDRYCIQTEQRKNNISSQFGGVFMSMLISYTLAVITILTNFYDRIISWQYGTTKFVVEGFVSSVFS